jgi:hypothetical protein
MTSLKNDALAFKDFSLCLESFRKVHLQFNKHFYNYRWTSLYAMDVSQKKLAYNEFAYNESNRKPK